MKHATEIEGHETPQQLARSLANLRYDVLVAVLMELASELKQDSAKDLERDRPQIATCLRNMSEHISLAGTHCMNLWALCAKHMK